MDTGETSLPDTINPNNFPAKLWRLVNNPGNKAICWDSQGEFIIIDQRLFEAQVLSPAAAAASDSADAFKTSNFSSFVRQLNLYGFRKADAPVRDYAGGDNVVYHHFHNPNFKRDHPELVARLRRLTVDNKAKLQAGLDVSCRPPSRYQRYSDGDDSRERCVRRGSSSLPGPMHQESPHPYYPHKAQALTAHNGTPVPPRYLIRGHGAALSPTVFASDKGMPVSLSHLYAGVASSSNAVHIQKGLLGCASHGNPNFTSLNPPNAQFQPSFYAPVCQCYHPNLLASHMTGGGLQTGSFSPHRYYQATYPVDMFCRGDYSQNVQSPENQDVKKCDINLNAIFQIADEVMQTPPSSCLVKIESPEEPGPVSVPASNACNTMLCDSPASSTDKANPLRLGPILMAVPGKADLAKYRQQEDSVVSVPEQMPEDEIFEVTCDDAKDTEVTRVEISSSLEESSSSCTGSTPDI